MMIIPLQHLWAELRVVSVVLEIEILIVVFLITAQFTPSMRSYSSVHIIIIIIVVPYDDYAPPSASIGMHTSRLVSPLVFSSFFSTRLLSRFSPLIYKPFFSTPLRPVFSTRLLAVFSTRPLAFSSTRPQYSFSTRLFRKLSPIASSRLLHSSTRLFLHSLFPERVFSAPFTIRFTHLSLFVFPDRVFSTLLLLQLLSPLVFQLFLHSSFASFLYSSFASFLHCLDSTDRRPAIHTFHAVAHC